MTFVLIEPVYCYIFRNLLTWRLEGARIRGSRGKVCAREKGDTGSLAGQWKQLGEAQGSSRAKTTPRLRAECSEGRSGASRTEGLCAALCKAAFGLRSGAYVPYWVRVDNGQVKAREVCRQDLCTDWTSLVMEVCKTQSVHGRKITSCEGKRGGGTGR